MKYALILNTMLSPNIENIGYVPDSPITTNRQEVVDFYNSNLAETAYKDDKWHKIFRKDSPLEWFNEGNIKDDNDYWGGIYSFPDDVPDEAIRGFSLYKN